jgi:mRNA deadenylase 3'-5' endonuclease subunit Ccr4
MFVNMPEKGFGLILAFKRSKFSLVDTMYVDFADLGKVMNSKSYARPSWAMICLLTELSSGSHVIVGNTHLYGNPDMKYITYAQAYYYHEKAAEMAQKATKLFSASEDHFWPQILCGDFNQHPCESVSNMMLYDTQSLD